MPRRAVRDPRLASVRRRRAGAAAQGRPVPARRADPRPAQAAAEAALRRAVRAGRARSRTARACCGSRAILRALETGARPSRRCCPPTRRCAPASSGRRSGATRCSSRSSGASCGRAVRRAPGAMRATPRARGCPCRGPLARLSAPLVARMAQAANGADDAAVRADLLALAGPPGPDRRLDRGRHARRRRSCTRATCRSPPRCACSPPSGTSRPAVDDRPAGRAGAARVPGLPGRRARRDAPRGLAARQLAPLALPHGQRDRRDARDALPVAGGGEQRHADPPAAAHGRARRLRDPQAHVAARGRGATLRRAVASRCGSARLRSAPTSVSDARAAPDGRVGAARAAPARGRAGRAAPAAEHAHAGERLAARDRPGPGGRGAPGAVTVRARLSKYASL